MCKTLAKTKSLSVSCLLTMLLLTACTSHSSNYRKQVVNYYMPVGWLKYKPNQQSKAPKKYSGYKLILQAKKIDKGLQEVINFYGQPDFVRASAKNKLNLAYLQEGIVLSFTLKSGVAPFVIEYEKFNNLSQYLVKSFKEHH